MNSSLVGLVPIIISSISMIVAGLSYLHSKRARVSSIVTELTNQANLINEATPRYKIPGPYALRLGIKSSDKIKKFEALHAVFLHRINLLCTVYRNRKYLGRKTQIFKSLILQKLQYLSDYLGCLIHVRLSIDFLKGGDFRMWNLKNQ